MILPEQVERYALDETTILQNMASADNELEFQDVIVGDKGKIATLFIRTSYTNSMSSSQTQKLTYTFTIMARKEKGKWYLDIANSSLAGSLRSY